jgi:hypothetical protein
MRRHSYHLSLIVMLAAYGIDAARAQTPPRAHDIGESRSLAAPSGHVPTSTDARLERFLRRLIYKSRADDIGATRYARAFVSLHGSRQTQVIVRLMGRSWCGSGGCETLILNDDGRAFHLVSKISVTQLPIRVLETRSHGWRDLGVEVSGGGILTAYEARLSFNGAAYPSNPTTPPSEPLKRAMGRMVIAEGQRDGALTPPS